MSVNKGQTISFKIKSSTSNYHIDILRLGYYQNGDGARLIASNLAPTGTSTQPACQTFSTTGLIDCGNWAVSRSWTVPSTAVSGVYIAHLVRNDTGGDSQIVFVVRDDSSHSDILLQTSDATWQAYNTYGGNSLYQCTVACPPGDPAAYKSAYKVSYNRPFHTAEDDSGRSWLFTGPEYPMIRYLERNGYDVSYTSSADVGRNPALLKNHKVFMSSGHDEYWSASQRSAVEAARDAGVNLAFFTGNEMFWKTRWEPSADGTNTPGPHPRLLQGHALHRASGPRRVDRDVARPALHDAVGERHPGERGDRPDLPGQLGDVADHRALRLQEPAPVAQHRRDKPDVGAEPPARAQHPGLRVGPGRRQRLPPERRVQALRRRP